MTARYYHLTLDLSWASRQPDIKLTGMLRDASGRILTASDVRERLRQAQRQGYDVLPMCQRHDKRGLCQGHLIEEPMP